MEARIQQLQHQLATGALEEVDASSVLSKQYRVSDETRDKYSAFAAFSCHGKNMHSIQQERGRMLDNLGFFTLLC